MTTNSRDNPSPIANAQPVSEIAPAREGAAQGPQSDPARDGDDDNLYDNVACTD